VKPGTPRAGRPLDRISPFLLFVLLALPAAAFARELHWSAMDVRARLDDSGTLHVVERQAMVFTGDWNGGERIFRVRPGETLTLESLSRIEPDGTTVPLAKGDLSEVDHYDWTDAKTLRWRSRLPSDPAFENTEKVYEIAYTLAGILTRLGNGYLFDHDFVFPDRDGAIERATVALTLDPAWKAETRLPPVFTRGRLVRGEGFRVRVPLAYAGSGQPAANHTLAPRGARPVLLVALAAIILWQYLAFRARERALGRFAPLPPVDSIDSDWLEKNLLNLAPEEAGALWDEKTGPPEVSAVLARLAAEKKIEARAEGKELHLKRLVSFERFNGYDEDLARALFFGGREETDTEAIRKHYRSSGFDPAGKIRTGLEQKLAALPDARERSEKPSPWPAPLLFLAGIAALVLAAGVGNEDPGFAVGAGIFTVILWGVAALFAYLFQKRIDRVDAALPMILWAPALFLWFGWRGYRDGDPVSLAFLVGIFLLRAAIVFSIFQLAKTRDGPKRIARRKQLAAARNYFRRELESPTPRLSDSWFPYVVAFGLTGEADRWFRAHGASASSSGAWSGAVAGSSSSSSSSGSAWTGGGGAFGGAGASASWAVAAGGLAAGVAAPSSSGGGGGGGSSGGGGGGGW
jgi:uncharacterized membrane protein YgcG